MKILLVDDEPHVTRAIQQLVNWDELSIDTVLTASSGHDALEQMELYVPEILMTDVVMPDMTGLDLIKTVHANYPHTKILMISGYSDFEYIHTAMLHGGMDYLLKPLTPGALTSAIRKARDAWEKEDSERSIKRHDKQTIQRISHLAIENLLEKYFYQENTTAVHTELTTLLPELSNASNCTLCVLDHRYCYQPAGTLAPNYVAIESSLRDILQRTGSGYLIHYSAKPSQSILFIYRQHDSILRALEKVIMEVNLHTQLSLHLGVCGPLPFPLCFRKAYDQAEAAFFYVLAGRTPQILVPWQEEMQKSPAPPSLNMASLFSCLLGGSEQGLRAAISQFCAENIRRDISLAELDALLTTMHVQFTEWYNSLQLRYNGCKLSAPDSLEWTEYADTRGLFSAEKFAGALYKNLEIVQGQLHRAPSDMRIQHVVQYLEDNYAEPFSQEECAARFCMNRDYLCHLFTKELGVSMINYLNEVRIRHAKELLADASISIKDIAHQVGFEDEKYFARQFKRQENVTAAEYRAHLVSRWAKQ